MSKQCTASACVPCGASLKKRLMAGAIGGVAGGAVYAVLIQKMGMFPMMASMMGSSSPAVGVMVHLVISILFGLGLGVLLRWIPSCPGKNLMAAVLYGVFLWVIGPMLMLPLMMGAPLFHVDAMAETSLYWHIAFAVVALIVARVFLWLCPNK